MRMGMHKVRRERGVGVGSEDSVSMCWMLDPTCSAGPHLPESHEPGVISRWVLHTTRSIAEGCFPPLRQYNIPASTYGRPPLPTSSADPPPLQPSRFSARPKSDSVRNNVRFEMARWTDECCLRGQVPGCCSAQRKRYTGPAISVHERGLQCRYCAVTPSTDHK